MSHNSGNTGRETVSGRRQTRQRDAVLRAVQTLGQHPDVKTVFDAVRQEIPNISLATVYRNLDVLTALGQLNEVHLDSQVRFDVNVTHHGHLICRSCGSIEDIDIGPVEGRVRRAYRASGYGDVSVNIDLYGVCPGCEGASQQRDFSR